MDKFAKLRDGDFWVLDTPTPSGVYSEGIRIVQDSYDESEEAEELPQSVMLYLWGVDGTRNPYLTPRDFLVNIIKRTFNIDNAEDLVDDGFVDPPLHTMGMYTVGVNKGTSQEQCVCGTTPGEAVLHALSWLPSETLMDIINFETMNSVRRIYCINGDPKHLSSHGNFPDTQQIGYALVDVVEMENESCLDDSADIVDEYLAIYNANAKRGPLESKYHWEYYVWDEIDQDWVFQESGGDYDTDDPVENGFFNFWETERHVYWQDAVLDEWVMADDDSDVTIIDNDWPPDEDVDEDEDDWFDDFEDFNVCNQSQDGFFIEEKVM